MSSPDPQMEKFKGIRVKSSKRRPDRGGKITLDITLYPSEEERGTREERGDYIAGMEDLPDKPINVTMTFSSKGDLFRFPDALSDSLFKRCIISECANIATLNDKRGKHNNDMVYRIKRDSRWLYCFFEYWSSKIDILPIYVYKLYDTSIPKIKSPKNVQWKSVHSIKITQYCLAQRYPDTELKSVFKQKSKSFGETYIYSDAKVNEPQTHKQIKSTYFDNIPPEVVRNYPVITFHSDSTFNPLKNLLDIFVIPIP